MGFERVVQRHEIETPLRPRAIDHPQHREDHMTADESPPRDLAEEAHQRLKRGGK